MPDGRMLLAVLIDADNIPAKHASAIMREITTYGEPALRRVYGDWSSSSLSAWKKEVVELGMVANQETANTKGKNASDIGLVIDAMDILHTGRFDGFVIVSSDSDFTALANRLREDGVEVIGIGEGKAPASLRNVCNRFILIENIIGEEKSDKPKKSNKNEQASNDRQPPSKAIPLVIKAMNSIDPEGEWYSLGQLGQYIIRAHPDFDPRTYGSPKLSELLVKTGRFETQKKPGQNLQVRRLD
ncbi:NYN domain-containing protein [Yoonia litorea]|uniref:OST-HTH/LOTUS domain-containing protein n=1 Tax=Yoonia litorea TaxID=1123755 RepID=A0A1I6L2S9_9RHOB|nr:NYN domain-containing protein [Yoonia litorea]SFR97530.1 OST-HTH/LOTUS domain-containing protein [Yoonia litorea]